MIVPTARVLLVGDAPLELHASVAGILGAGDLACEVATLPLRSLVAQRLPGRAFDVVLLHLSRLGEGAPDAARRVLAAAAGRPVLVLTDTEDEPGALRLLRAGVQDCIVLGDADGEALVRAIRRATARSRGAREQAGAGPRERILFDAALALAESLDFDDTVRSLAELAVPALADWCVIDVLDEDGTLQAFEAAAQGGEDAGAGPALRRYTRSLRGGTHPVVRVLESGEPRIFSSFPAALREDDGADEGSRPGSPLLRSTVSVPMVAHGRVLGVITLAGAEGRRPFDTADLELAEKLARIAALEVENARLYRAAQEAQRSAEQATRAREEVLGFVAHDLRNPLSASNMHVGKLLSAGLPEAERRRHLQAIRECTASMDHLIQDLLDVTRLAAGGISVEPEPLVPGALLTEAASMFGVVADEEGISLCREVCGDPPAVLGNRERVLQVLSNLVGNAIKFTPPGGTIWIRAGACDEGVRFSVADTGSGIAEEDLSRVFDRFWHARDGRRAGAGLGLAIARGIVEAHGGTIWVESHVGVGSVFHFTLPASREAAVPRGDDPPRAVPPAVPAEAADTVRVLLVDDHAMVRRGLEELLLHVPRMEVVGQAGTGEEAVEMTRLLRPHVVVMDLGMPGIGGLEAIRRIQELGVGTTVLALTADTEDESLLPVLQAGGSGYVCKTSAQDDLVAAIEAAARNEVFLYPGATRLLLQSYREAAKAAAVDPLRTLDEREREILALTAEGYTSVEIGRKLYLAANTVDTYRSRLMYKLGLTHRSELVRFALQSGLLRAE